MDTSNLKETLNAIDASIEGYRKAEEQGKKLKRLMKNPDFISVILEGYIDTEAKKLFKILTDPSGASPYSPEAIQLKLEAISHFKSVVGTDDYKGTIEIEAEQAPLDILREETYRKEVTAEFAGEEI